MKTFRDLKVWQKSMIVVRHIYKYTQKYPRDELFGLTTQTRRCAISIPCNMAEGYSRRSTKDYIRFLNISMGSLYELITLIEIAHSIQIINANSCEALNELIREIERMLSSLIKKIQQNP
jgi:four helix bundle protein